MDADAAIAAAGAGMGPHRDHRVIVYQVGKIYA
jgi:hypothetical protein